MIGYSSMILTQSLLHFNGWILRLSQQSDSLSRNMDLRDASASKNIGTRPKTIGTNGF